ncbi:MAG: right-handed parallel beta-helix repeat-containing protein, partial [Planctomycetota bacterium]
MKTQPSFRTGLIVIIAMSVIPSPGTGAPPEKISSDVLASSAPALDGAATDLAEGRVDQARNGLQRLAADPSQSSWIRGLARLGLAEASVARNHTAAAIATLQQMAADTTLLRAHRDMARHRLTAIQRRQQGLPPHDSAAHRAALPTIPEPAVLFHVAPDGSDTGDGSEEKPFPSLEAARNAARAWKRTHHGSVPEGSVEVSIRGGVYPVERTLQLTEEDSGTAISPVVYKATPGQRPIFHGGTRIRSWKPVADQAVRDRLHPSVRQRVRQADLKALRVTDLGDATALRRRPELFCNGVPQALARWPNEGFIKTGQILGTDTFTVWNRIPGCRDGKFRFVEDRPTRWTDEPDVRLYGYWFWDWFEEYQQVAGIDAQARTFTLSKPYSRYGYRKDQRYFAVNVLRELDRPGEWYLDRRTSVAYWLPPHDVDLATGATVLSVFKDPHVVMENVEHVIFQGFTFQDSRGDGIHIQGGANNLIAGCTFRRLGGDAVNVKGGRHHGVFGCTMHTLGCGGALVAGGDRETLARGDHFVENCTVYNISR